MSDNTTNINQSRSISVMYKDWFLDYASYVILERSVPFILDGVKPVQRRILHSLREMHDGRYHKVANIIGNTMKYHPHGDAAIGDALVKLGQYNFLIDTGFQPYSYNPIKRELQLLPTYNRDLPNTIFIRNIQKAQNRIQSSKPIKIGELFY